MSTEITPSALEGKLLVTSFWGGQERGVCVQLTPMEITAHGHTYTQLTATEALELCLTLMTWYATNSCASSEFKAAMEKLK